jgi:hypothetical protein
MHAALLSQSTIQTQLDEDISNSRSLCSDYEYDDVIDDDDTAYFAFVQLQLMMINISR